MNLNRERNSTAHRKAVKTYAENEPDIRRRASAKSGKVLGPPAPSPRAYQPDGLCTRRTERMCANCAADKIMVSELPMDKFWDKKKEPVLVAP